MRMICASWPQKVNLRWQCAKQPWWCTGSSTQRGRRRWLWLRCWEMSARSMQGLVGWTHNSMHMDSQHNTNNGVYCDNSSFQCFTISLCWTITAMAVKYIICCVCSFSVCSCHGEQYHVTYRHAVHYLELTGAALFSHHQVALLPGFLPRPQARHKKY